MTAPYIGLAALMRVAFSGGDLTPLGAELMDRAGRDPNDANALMDLSIALQLKGNRDIALAVQGEALKLGHFYHRPAKGKTGLRLLAILGPGDLMANTPVEFLLEDSDVDLTLCYLSSQLPIPENYPDHDVLLVAVGESDANQPLLADIETLTANWPRPVLNPARLIARLSRDGAAELLDGAEGVLAPRSARLDRAALAALARGEVNPERLVGGGFPVLLRPIGSHAGQGLVRIDDVAALGEWLAAVEEEKFFLTPFVDYRDADGLYRKYRIVLIQGKPYVCHMAISEHWMIHYLNAGMSENAAKREEEARFMAGFDEDFARRHATAFAAIQERTGLDYLGIDCAETADGRLLVFEVDNAMIVHALDPVDIFPYKQPQMRKVFAAFRTTLGEKAGVAATAVS